MAGTSIIPIRPGVALDAPDNEPNEEVVKRLAELLEMAKAGEIRGIAYAILHPGRFTTYNSLGHTTRGVIGALTLLQFDMCKADSDE